MHINYHQLPYHHPMPIEYYQPPPMILDYLSILSMSLLFLFPHYPDSVWLFQQLRQLLSASFHKDSTFFTSHAVVFLGIPFIACYIMVTGVRRTSSIWARSWRLSGMQGLDKATSMAWMSLMLRPTLMTSKWVVCSIFITLLIYCLVCSLTWPVG